jgi:adenylate cyclase
MDRQEHKVERQLAAIFAADVAGSSRLMEQDEFETLRTLTAHREIMDVRIANTMVEGVLTDFPSVGAAVGCPVEVGSTQYPHFSV